MQPYIHYIVKELEVFQVFLKYSILYNFRADSMGFFTVQAVKGMALFLRPFGFLLPYFKAILSFRDSFIVFLQKKDANFTLLMRPEKT